MCVSVWRSDLRTSGLGRLYQSHTYEVISWEARAAKGQQLITCWLSFTICFWPYRRAGESVASTINITVMITKLQTTNENTGNRKNLSVTRTLVTCWSVTIFYYKKKSNRRLDFPFVCSSGINLRQYWRRKEVIPDMTYHLKVRYLSRTSAESIQNYEHL